MLRANKVDFTPHFYDYVPRGGVSVSAEVLGVDPHHVVKTLIMEDELGDPLIILMHGDCSVNTGALARQSGHKSVNPCKPEVAQKHSGYLVGGTSPFGTRKAMPLFIQSSILELDWIYINAGKRGFLIEINPGVLVDVLEGQAVDVAQPHGYDA
jgi:Cys-tRNA(Pro) deacylase